MKTEYKAIASFFGLVLVVSLIVFAFDSWAPHEGFLSHTMHVAVAVIAPAILYGTVLIRAWRRHQRAEEVLRLQAEIIVNMTEGVYIVGLNDVVIRYANPKFEEMFGYEPGEMIGKHASIVNAPIDKNPEETAQEIMEIIYQTGEWHGEVNNIKKDGTPFWCYANVSVFEHSEYGRVLVAVHTDITEHKQTEEQFENIFSLSPDMVGVFTTEGRLIRINPSWEAILGYKTEELLEMGWAVLVHPDDVERTNKEVEEQLKGSPVVDYINRYKCKDGSYKTLEWRATFAKGGIVHATARDITERKRVETELENRARLNQSILDSMPCVALLIRPHTRQIVALNRTAIEAGAVIDKQCFVTWAKRKEPCPWCLAPALWASGQAQHLEVEAGGILWDVHWLPVGEDLYMHYAFDITERKRMEEALRESEERYRLLFERSSDAIFLTDINNGRYLDANAAAERLTGRLVAELTTLTTREVTLTGAASRLQKATTMGDVLDFGEVTYVRPDGTERMALLSAVHLNEQLIFGIAHDITERKQAEEAVKREKERAEGYLDIAGVMLTTIDVDEKITLINKKGCEILGYKEEELIGRNWFDILVPERIREERRSIFQSLITNDIELTERENPLLTKGGEERIIAFHNTTIKDQKGQVVGRLLSGADITERKRAEEREKQLQEELSLSNRLASIGELAAGVAHEINNPLTGIIGFSQRLMRKSSDETTKRDLERIHSEAQRAARVVENLLTFARRREPKKEYSDINEILARALELRAYELRTSNIELVVELAPGIPKAMVDFQQIEQVFLNIILNAEQAMTEANRGGKLAIKTRKVKGGIRVSFADDGPGISAEVLGKLFDPFFTTRGDRGGTGLGLSVCHGIVTEHGGKIYAESKPGKDTTFFVELPLATEEINETKVTEEEPVRRG